MKARDPVFIAAALAHVLAWAASIWLAVGPSYQVVTGTPEGQVRTTKTLIEANGLWVISLLLVPVALTGLSFLTASFIGNKGASGRVLLWFWAVLLLGGCFLAIWSIGLFYLPAAFLLGLAALIASVRRPAPGLP